MNGRVFFDAIRGSVLKRVWIGDGTILLIADTEDSGALQVKLTNQEIIRIRQEVEEVKIRGHRCFATVLFADAPAMMTRLTARMLDGAGVYAPRQKQQSDKFGPDQPCGFYT